MAQSIACPNCKRAYAVKPELAGKRAKCKCGAKIQFPAADDVLTEADMIEAPPVAAAPARSARPAKRAGEQLEQPNDPYNMAPGSPPPRAAESALCVNCRAPLPPEAVICVSCGTNQRTGQAVQTQVVRPMPRAAPEKVSVPVDDSLSTGDWLLIIFCGGIALAVALIRGLQGKGWRMMITVIVVQGIFGVIGAVLSAIAALTAK